MTPSDQTRLETQLQLRHFKSHYQAAPGAIRISAIQRPRPR
jgi:hypothetical protein